MKPLTATGILLGGQNAEGKREGKDREITLQPLLCWHCCQRQECSSYPDQFELTSSHMAAAHKTTFAQNGYISARPVCPYNSHDNPTARPEGHRGHSQCLVSQV